jgi:hypothetical protein
MVGVSMTSIKITIKEDDKARDFIRFISDIDYLDIQVERDVDAEDPNGIEALGLICGMWKDRDITLESIRKKAWVRGAQQ